MAREPFTTSSKKQALDSQGSGGAGIPLALRTHIALDGQTQDTMRQRLLSKLDIFSGHIERVSLRLADVNGPRGGVDVACRLKIVLRGLPSVVVESRARDVASAVARAADMARRSAGRTLRRSGWSLGSKRARAAATAQTRTGRTAGLNPRPDDDGSLIGGRVGRSRANLERALARPEKYRRDVYVDTAAPGVSASDRRAGYGATAARNTKRNTAGMAFALEDSRTAPSRKSTRKSHNRAKAATLLERKAQLQLQSPKSRAARARVRRS